MNTLIKLIWKLTATVALSLLSCFATTDSFAKKLYKSVNADGKITYSNHLPANSQYAENISLLKDSPKISVINKQYSRASKKS